MNPPAAVGYITALSGLLLVAVSILALVTVRLLRYRAKSVGPSDTDSLNFNLARYEPMRRLLAAEEMEFLAGQPGYRPEIGKRFRKNRRRVFRMYLSELSNDFHRIHRAARAVIAESPAEGANLVGILVRQQIIFWRSLLVVEMKLILPGTPRIDVSGLVAAIETMRIDLSRAATHGA